MKFIIFLFLCFKPILEVYSSDLAGAVSKYIPMTKDVTRVELDFRKPLKVLDQVEPDSRDWLASNILVIRRAPLAPWRYPDLPIQSDGITERPSAVLPETVSFPDAKKRLSDLLLLKRNGRKEEELYSENY